MGSGQLKDPVATLSQSLSHPPKIAMSIVHDLRALDPPARFVAKDKDSLWNDIGDKKFREKVSQALREHQPFIKAVLDGTNDNEEEERKKQPQVKANGNSGKDESKESSWFLEQLFVEEQEEKPGPSGDLRRAFSATRNEQVPIVDDDPLLNKTCQEPALNLSDVNVSQGPSFMVPDSSRSSISLSNVMYDLVESSKATSDSDAFEKFSLDLRSFMATDQTEVNWSDVFGETEGRNEAAPEPIYNNPEGQKLCIEKKTRANCAKVFHGPIRRPGLVKRETSNQNETTDTRKGYANCGYVKRCVLNRDKSDISRKLKQEYPPDISDIDADQDTMITLSRALEHSFPKF